MKTLENKRINLCKSLDHYINKMVKIVTHHKLIFLATAITYNHYSLDSNQKLFV